MMSGEPPVKPRAARRVPLETVCFSDTRGQVKGFAHGWFFWVHGAFKGALDIRFVERIDAKPTLALREKNAQERFGLSLSDLRRRRRESVEMKSNFQEIMKISRKVMLETETSSPAYTFRAGDSFESRCGEWYLKVTHETVERVVGIGDDTLISHEVLGVTLYRRAGGSDARWIRQRCVELHQSELAALLKTGSAASIDLIAVNVDQGSATQIALF
ncbi:hypothetical protein [Caballeronia sp. LZ035]|uniref:hypothetical protein n=1 Tax=Caballeronia sp. LZ035 TaxID=3038568 RepID=UPI00285804A6|nr:hypothetical protein [Caballeronia sp. LZ035]MDR5757792.1 hypothetical protein [Caballeronia sp. LZ035]